MANSSMTNDSDCFNLSRLTPEQLETLLTPEKRFSAAEAVLFTIGYLLISLMGLVGNGLVCYVVVRSKKMRTIRNVFIANMSLANFMFAGVLVPLMWLPRLQNYWDFSDFACKEVMAQAGMNLFCSAFTIIACAADRYYAVSSRRVSNTLTHGQAGLILALIWGIAGLFSIPFWMYYEVTEIFAVGLCPPDNTRVIRRMCNMLMPVEVQQFVSVLQALFLLPIPLMALAVFNCKLSTFLRQNRQLNLALRKTKSDGNKRNRTNLLLFAMAASYGLLWLPFTICVIISDMFPSLITEIDPTAEIYTRIEVFFHMVSSASVCVNPFLYGFLNSNFNAAFHEIWRCLFSRRTNSRSHLLPKGNTINGLIPIGPMESLRKFRGPLKYRNYTVAADINGGNTVTTVLDNNV